MTFFIIIWLLLAAWAVSIARKQGRSTVLAFFLGLIFGIFAIIGYAIIGETEDKKIERMVRYREILK
jgi:hypothetical protein